MNHKVLPGGTFWYLVSIWRYWLVLGGYGSLWNGTIWPLGYRVSIFPTLPQLHTDLYLLVHIVHNPRYIGHQINPGILCVNNNGFISQLGRLQNGLFKATKCFISKHQKWWNNFTNYYDNNFDWSSLIKRELVHFLPLKNLRITIRRKSLESLQ